VIATVRLQLCRVPINESGTLGNHYLTKQRVGLKRSKFINAPVENV
jgi:hypothetical protein